jgi:hypothetical protein
VALVVEDGTGKNNANAYALVASVDTHHGDRGNSSWADFSVADKEAALIRATDYIDKRFGRKFRGYKENKDQALEWPRLDAYDNDDFAFTGTDAVPRALQKAVAEYALRAAQIGVLAPDPTPPVPAQSMESGAEERDPAVTTGEVTRSRAKVGPLEEETWYQTASKTASSNLSAGSKAAQSTVVNDFIIPEYPEADLWMEELLRSSQSTRLVLS